MDWYVVDVIDKAFDRTRKCLLEPFDFWKWAKLAIIIMLIGGAGSSFNGGGNNYSASDSDVQKMTDIFDNKLGDMSPPDLSSNIALIGAAIVLLILFILFLAYVSNVMEFVFVESLVKNDVRFWEYSRRFLGSGFYLFILRFIVTLIILIPIIILGIVAFLSSATISMAAIIPFILIMIPLILLLAILGGIIASFINLAIPVSIYNEQGIFSAFASVFRRFRIDWKQIVLYWIGRAVLAIIVGIIVFIAALVMILALGLISLVIDGSLYLILTSIGSSETILWIVLGTVIFIQILVFIALMLLLAVPGRVFIKFHMLSFLEKWYPEIDMPMFDAKNDVENMNLDINERNKSIVETTSESVSESTNEFVQD